MKILKSASVIIPFYNRLQSVKITLQILLDQSLYHNYDIQVIIVDSNTCSNDLINISNRYKGLRNFSVDILHVNNNLSTKRNSGVTIACNELLIFIDDDCIPDELFLYNYFSSFKNDLDILSGLVKFDINYFNSNFIRFRNDIENLGFTHNSTDNTISSDHARAMNFAILRNTFLSYNLNFDESFLGYGWEDSVFFNSCYEKGLNVYSCYACIWHDDRTDLRNYLIKMRHTGSWYSEIIEKHKSIAKKHWFSFISRLCIILVIFYPFFLFFEYSIYHILKITDKYKIFYILRLYRLLTFLSFLLGYVNLKITHIKPDFENKKIK